MDLEALLNKEIEQFDGDSKRHKSQYRWSQTLVIVLTSASTIISAWALSQEPPPKSANFAIVIIGALATSISAWVEMRRSRDLWRHERLLLHALRALERRIQFKKSIGAYSNAEQEEIFRQLNDLLRDSGAKWREIGERSDDKPAEAGEKPSTETTDPQK